MEYNTYFVLHFLVGNKTLNILLHERKLIKNSYSKPKHDTEKKRKRKKSSMVNPASSPYNAPAYNNKTPDIPSKQDRCSSASFEKSVSNDESKSKSSEMTPLEENPSKSPKRGKGKSFKHKEPAERLAPNPAKSNKSETIIGTQVQDGLESETHENFLKPPALKDQPNSTSSSPRVIQDDQCVIEYPFPDSLSAGILPDFTKCDLKRQEETTILEYVDETEMLEENSGLLAIPKKGNAAGDNISILSDRSLFRENAEPLPVSSDDLAKVHSPSVIETSTPRNVPVQDDTHSPRNKENIESITDLSPIKSDSLPVKSDLELESLVSGSDAGILQSPTTSITNLTTDTDGTNTAANDSENIEPKSLSVSKGDTETEMPVIASAPPPPLTNRRKISTDDGTSPVFHLNKKKNHPVHEDSKEFLKTQTTEDEFENVQTKDGKDKNLVEKEPNTPGQEISRTDKSLKTRSKTASDLLHSDKEDSVNSKLVSRNISLLDAQEIDNRRNQKGKTRRGLDFLSDKIDGGRSKSPVDGRHSPSNGRLSPRDGRRSKSPTGRGNGKSLEGHDGCLQEFIGHRAPVTQCYMTDSTLITSSMDGTLMLWNVVSGKRMRVVKVGKPINDFICFPIPLGFHVIITGNNDGMMNVYSLREGTSKTFSITFAGEYDGHKPNPIRAMAVSPDFSNLATGCCFFMKQISLVSPIYTIVRGTLKLWCLSHIIQGVEMIETNPDGQGLLKDKPPIEIKTMKQLIAHSKAGSRKISEDKHDKVVDRNWGIRALAYTPDSSKLVIGFGHPEDTSASDSKMLVVVDSQTLETLWVENSVNYQINNLQFFPVTFGSGVKQWEMVASGIHNLAKITLLSIGE